MSKKFKSQASSARAASTFTGGFGSGSSFQTASSPLSYVTELPDLSQISEPNAVVAFKNLGKKDSVTKSKAIEDLQEHCNGELEQNFLQAWAELYPRTSIDNSRRVRQLAHTFQGQVTVSAGKRIAPLLSKVIGSWLAGTFDSDKSVSRSAQDALEKSFPTPEKRVALWSIYKDALFTYIEDAVTVQTVGSLSDERTTNADDAMAKYVRVVGTAVNMLTKLLKNDTQTELVSSLLGTKHLWELAYHGDPYLRRSICDLVAIASETFSTLLDWSMISACFLSKGLNSEQIGSSRQYAAALLSLTQKRPELWTTDYTAKTSISKRLIQFLRKGSQNGPEDVWSSITALIRTVPEQVWSGDKKTEGATNLVEALRKAVTLPSERPNAAAAWATYVQTALWLAERLDDDQSGFILQQVIPIVKQYITRKEERQWTVTARPVQICRGILIGVLKLGLVPIFDEAWSDLVSATIDEMKLSQPESSKDFQSSQDAIIDQAHRLFNVKAELQKSTEQLQTVSTFERGDARLLDATIQLLQTRNAKPSGAAGLLESLVNQTSFDKDSKVLQAFLRDDVPKVLNSPSAEKLASVAMTCGHTNIIDHLLSEQSENAQTALCRILSRIDPKDLSQASQEHIMRYSLQDLSNSRVMAALMQNPSLQEIHESICRQIQHALSSGAAADVQLKALKMLESMTSRSSSANTSALEQHRDLLLPNLLVVADSGSEVSEIANTVISKLNSKLRSGVGSTSIIQQQLQGDGTPLGIFTLIDLASGVAQNNNGDLGAILPMHNVWENALMPHISVPRSYSLSITSPLQGSIFTLEHGNAHNTDDSFRDQDGFSLAFRLTLYIIKLFASDPTPQFNTEHLQATYTFLPRALQLVNEKLTVESANYMWLHSTPEVLQEAADTLSEGLRLIQSWLDDESFVKYWIGIMHEVDGSDAGSYVTALAWTNVVAQYIDRNGPSRILQEYEHDLKTAPRSQNVIKSAALLAATREYLSSTTYGERLLNELVASVTQTNGSSIEPLILLNVLLSGDGDFLEAIPNQRVVFLLKNLVRLLGNRDTTGLQSETMKLLAATVPEVADIYGEHWEQIISAMTLLWSEDIDISAMNSSARLYTRLKGLSKSENTNEDLQDSLKSAKKALDAGLLDCLQQLGQLTSVIDLPRDITTGLIKRQLGDVTISEDQDLFTLLSSPVEAVQTAVFEVLHLNIPQHQERLSLEMLLEKQTVQLPQHLLDLLAEDMSDYRQYMLVWKLTFDHFSGASHKLQEAYTAIIKEGCHIGSFLDRICEVLRLVDGRVIDASKFDIAEFKIDEAESPEKELQWLAIHNYYCSLRCTPSLVKDWFLSQKNRVKVPLEAWTQKYISPLIISTSLTTVAEWAETQDEDDKSLTVKSSPRASELIASIAIDPESPPISLAVSLPGSYPLESPVVVSRSRVGVSEKNWQSWQRTIQIIIFSTGSIIEGLIAFRRNVQGALKGQSECAICYSIIGTDMQTPNKKCGTCKNNFHGTCLFRWFKSSNSSSCPLCRNNFNYA